MSNEGGVPGPGGQDPQDPYRQPPGQPPYGQPPSPPPYGQQPNPSGQPPGQPPSSSGQPQYGQYAPPGYQAQTPVPTGPTVPWAPPSIGESHRFGWRSFGRNAGVWIVMGLLFFVAGVVVFLAMNPWFGQAFAELPAVVQSGDPAALDRWEARLTTAALGPIPLVLSALSGVILQIMWMPFYAAALASTRKQRIGFGDFFALRNWGGILLLAVLMSAINNVIGMIPGVAWVLQLVVGFLLVAAPYFVLAKNMNAIEAMTSSVKLVTSNFGIVVLAYLIVIGYMFAGACTCGLALLAISPFSLLFGAHLFRRLHGELIEAEQTTA